MKRLFYIITLIVACLSISACTKGDTGIVGTYEYSNGQTGTMRIRETYEFSSNGSVYHSSKIGTTSEYNTKGCELYYKLEGSDIVIYHGTIGWKSEVRNTPYASGKYYGETLEIDDKVFIKR